jgi:hypothetical protein
VEDYRLEGTDRYKIMTLATDEFIRRFLIHVLLHGFHRIRLYGLFAKTVRADNVARARQLLGVQKVLEQDPMPMSPTSTKPPPCRSLVHGATDA